MHFAARSVPGLCHRGQGRQNLRPRGTSRRYQIESECRNGNLASDRDQRGRATSGRSIFLLLWRPKPKPRDYPPGVQAAVDYAHEVVDNGVDVGPGSKFGRRNTHATRRVRCGRCDMSRRWRRGRQAASCVASGSGSGSHPMRSCASVGERRDHALASGIGRPNAVRNKDAALRWPNAPCFIFNSASAASSMNLQPGSDRISACARCCACIPCSAGASW